MSRTRSPDTVTVVAGRPLSADSAMPGVTVNAFGLDAVPRGSWSPRRNPEPVIVTSSSIVPEAGLTELATGAAAASPGTRSSSQARSIRKRIEHAQHWAKTLWELADDLETDAARDVSGMLHSPL